MLQDISRLNTAISGPHALNSLAYDLLTYCEPGLLWIFRSWVDWVLSHIRNQLMDSVGL